jgi:hypothetical protein
VSLFGTRGPGPCSLDLAPLETRGRIDGLPPREQASIATIDPGTGRRFGGNVQLTEAIETRRGGSR